MPLVSVLLPYRDAAATLGDALGSLLDQRGLPGALEIVAIDDGSRDGGPGIVAALAERRSIVTDGDVGRRVTIAQVATGGVGIARALAAGLERARGAWIARMDADDLAHPDRLARQLEVLGADPSLGALGCRVELFGAGGFGEGLARYVAWQNGLVTAADHARQIFVEAPLCHPSVLLRRAALEAVGAWRDTSWPEDYDLWLRLDAAGWRLAKVPDVLLRWRHHPGRLTFTDRRYAPERLLEAKAPHLARRLLSLGRPITIWGAGKTGKRLARSLEPHALRPTRFIDIDPHKIGSTARGAPITAPTDLLSPSTIVVAVGEPGARDVVRARLDSAGLVEGSDYLCAA